MAGAATRLAIFLAGYLLVSSGDTSWLPLRSGHGMSITIIEFDYPRTEHTAFPPNWAGPSDRRSVRHSGPAFSGHSRRLQAADLRRAGTLDPQEMNILLAKFFSCFCFELGTTVGYSTAFLATLVAGKRQPLGALSRQTTLSGFLGWPPAALAFTFFLGSLTTTWPTTKRGKLPAKNRTRTKAWPRTTWKTCCGVLRLRTTPWPTTARRNPASRKKRSAGNLAFDYEKNKQQNLATSKAKKAVRERHYEDVATFCARRKEEAWPPWELLYFADILVPVRLWRSGTATRSCTPWPSSSEAACMRVIHSIHDCHHYHHRH